VRLWLAEQDDNIVVWDSFDQAIIGVGWRFNEGPVALYDRDRILSILVEEGMSYEDAVEHFEYNIIGGWIGEKTPMVAVLFKEVR